MDAHELAVLFTHHADDATTRNNLATVRHYNPGVPVIPISNWGVKLPGGFYSKDMAAGWRRFLPSYRGSGLMGAWRRFRMELEKGFVWRNVDLVAYMWMLWKHRPIHAKRWVVFEWDMYCNVSLASWFRESWNDDVVSTFVQTPGGKVFPHFSEGEMGLIPQSLRPFCMGTNPWAGMFFSDAALTAIARTVRTTKYYGAISEVRVATVAHSLGYRLTRNPNSLSQRTLRAVSLFPLHEINAASVWHRVKEHQPLTLVPQGMTSAA